MTPALSATRRTRVAIVIALAALVSTALVSTALVSPAQAEEIDPATASQCATGRVCLWSTSFYGGNFFSTTSTTAVSVGLFTVAHSTWNNSPKAAYVYPGLLGSGLPVCLPPGSTMTSTALASLSVRLSSSATC